MDKKLQKMVLFVREIAIFAKNIIAVVLRGKQYIAMSINRAEGKTMYKDIESGEFVTLAQLEQEYAEMVKNGSVDPAEIPFEWYIHNSLTCFGGTLERMA